MYYFEKLKEKFGRRVIVLHSCIIGSRYELRHKLDGVRTLRVVAVSAANKL